jgi:hypothetical protein
VGFLIDQINLSIFDVFKIFSKQIWHLSLNP